MKQEFSLWAGGLAIGAVVAAVLWVVIDSTFADRTAVGMAVCIGITLGIAAIWSDTQKKRRSFRRAEAAALAAARRPLSTPQATIAPYSDRASYGLAATDPRR